MEPLVLIEVLNDDEEIIKSHRFNSLPITCGRGYSCDLRFDDLYICPEHFSIQLGKEGELQLVDNNSVNGIVCLKDRSKVSLLDIKSKEIVKIGTTTLRIINTKTPLPPSIVASKLHLPVVRPRIRIKHCVSAFFAFLTAYYLNTYILGMRFGENQNLETLAKGVISGLTIFIPWSAAWALLGKIVIKKFRYWSHFFIVSGLCTAYMVFTKFAAYIEFAFGKPLLGTIVAIAISSVCMFISFSLHLFYSTRLKRGKRWLASGAIAILIVGMFALIEFKDSLGFSAKIPISTVIKPPWARLVDGISPSDLAKKVEKLHLDLELEE